VTTVAYKAGIMACDSCYAEDEMLITRRSKITRLASGALLGKAGDSDDRHVEALFAHVKTPRGMPTRKQILELQIDYYGLFVLPKGRIFLITITPPNKDKGHDHWSGGIDEIGESFYAIGTSAAHALTAMECNRSAKEAVKFACQRDLNSRPPIHVVPLKKPPRAAKVKPKRRA